MSDFRDSFYDLVKEFYERTFVRYEHSHLVSKYGCDDKKKTTTLFADFFNIDTKTRLKNVILDDLYEKDLPHVIEVYKTGHLRPISMISTNKGELWFEFLYNTGTRVEHWISRVLAAPHFCNIL